PLIVIDGAPVKWPRTLTQGGPLGSQTVDAQGNVLFRVDSGPLGPLSNQEATALVDRIFGLYSSIPTSSIRFVNAGPIQNPANGQPLDVNGSNRGRVLSGSAPTFQNPIVFDSDGSITGGGGVLGSFGFLQGDEATNTITEGFVVLNGGAISLLGEIPFIGVFTHEFGHFAGPLDHAQINGNIADFRGAERTIPPGFTDAQLYDLYGPFAETVFPFIIDAPTFGSGLNQFSNSGFFIASLVMDTKNALSNLYPAPGYRATDPGSPFGEITGRVVIGTASGDIPINGINVVARRINRGPYPPPPGTTAYPNNVVPLDQDGVPMVPPDLDATDSLATASSAVTGMDFGNGTYRIQGLPPGQYRIEVQQVTPEATGGSGIGPNGSQFPLVVPEQVSHLSPVSVTAGSVTTGIDIILNGFNTSAPALVNEREKNDKKPKAQALPFPAEVQGNAAVGDPGKVRIDFGDGLARIQDLFKFTVTSTGLFVITLDPISGAGDLDLYVLGDFSGKKISLSSPFLEGLSASPQSSEVVGVRLFPGTYYIGVSAFAGSFNYRLRIIPSQ
ncbi:MAG TPA: PPC domain-containing protein, partial [Blastocatellia bacterium]|nr:PPC domain-containing protein [Blastocatellia bacterium]